MDIRLDLRNVRVDIINASGDFLIRQASEINFWDNFRVHKNSLRAKQRFNIETQNNKLKSWDEFQSGKLAILKYINKMDM